MLQEFDLEIRDKKGLANVVADHLSRIVIPENVPMSDSFPDEEILSISNTSTPWYAHIVNYLVVGQILGRWSRQEKDRFFSKVKHYFWEDPKLFHMDPDQIIRRCVPEEEQQSVLNFCLNLTCRGHFLGKKTAAKVLQTGFYWCTLFKDVYEFSKKLFKGVK